MQVEGGGDVQLLEAVAQSVCALVGDGLQHYAVDELADEFASVTSDAVTVEGVERSGTLVPVET